MIIFLIIGIVLGAISVIFALQNAAIVTVTFFKWQMVSPLSVIIFLGILLGALIALLMFLPESINNYLRYKKLSKENEKLKEDLRKQKELTHFAKHTEPKPEDLKKIEDGVIEEHV